MAIWSVGLALAFVLWYSIKGHSLLAWQQAFMFPSLIWTWVLCVRCTWTLVLCSTQSRITVPGLCSTLDHIFSDLFTVFGLVCLLCVAPNRLISRHFRAALWESIVQSYNFNSPLEPAVPVDGSEVIAYHGTSSDHASAILQDGFVPSSGGMLGRGVYISRDMRKVQPYASRSRRGTILRLRVEVGRVATITPQRSRFQHSWQTQGFDTAWVPQGCGMVPSNLEEGCMADPARIEVLGRIEVMGLLGACAGNTGALVLWELRCGAVDTLAVILAVLLVIAPWRLIHLCRILRVGANPQHVVDCQSTHQELLSHPSSQHPHRNWHREVFWHAVAAILDVPCFFSCIVLAISCRLIRVYRAIQAHGGYFNNNVSGNSLLKPQLIVFSGIRELFCCEGVQGDQ